MSVCYTHINMLQEGDLNTLSLEVLKERCLEETNLYYKQGGDESRYCYELFRRAIVGHDETAWELINHLYHRQVLHWVRRHPAYHRCNENTLFFVNRAFEKLWFAIPSNKFHKFPELKHILRYLQMCVHSVIVDYLRAVEKENLVIHSGLVQIEEKKVFTPDEGYLFEQSEGSTECWNMVTRHIQSKKEMLVARYSFILGYKPREIFKHFPRVFSNTEEIYKTKEILLHRLRNDEELLKLAGIAREKM